MARRPLFGLFAILLLTGGAVAGVASLASASPLQLVLPQGDAFAVLGHSCGGIQEQVFATQFDPSSGYPDGDVYMKTSCGGSGRGGGYRSTTYTAWASASWDFTGAVVSYGALSGTATTDPNLNVTDANGNQLYNQLNQAYLVLASGFVPAPRVVGMSVSTGPAAGGTTVSLTGTGFTNATGVSFGGAAAASFQVLSDSSITAVTPSTGAGTVDVTVTGPGGTSATIAADQFTFIAAPVVTGIAPDTGDITGGTQVTISGSGFTGANAVSFGGDLAAFAVVDDSTITAYSPAIDTPDTSDVTVTTGGGTSAPTPADQFTWTSGGGGGGGGGGGPEVTGLSVLSGAAGGGTRVLITGTKLTGATGVTFGGLPAARFHVVGTTGTAVVAWAPADGLPGVLSVDVQVAGPNGTTAPTPADVFTYLPPLVTSLSVSSGAAGGNTKVVITGQDLTHASQVTFGGFPARFHVNRTGTTIWAWSPPEGGTGSQPVDVSVVAGAQVTTVTGGWSYLAPAVTSIGPASGPAGTTVHIKGTDLYGVQEVDFGTTAVTTFASATNGTIVVAAPAGSGTVDITVVTAAGTSAVTPADQFTY